MATTIRELMAPRPVVVPPTSTLVEVAQLMRDGDIGDVIVQDGQQLWGIVTDRDIVVRAVVEDQTPSAVAVSEICTEDLVTLDPNDSIDRAAQLMRENAVRRLPVTEDGRAVGVVSLGDLALEQDERSVLADISGADPNV